MSILLITLQKDMDPIGLRYIHDYLLKHSFHSSMLYLPDFDKKDADNEFKEIKTFIRRISPRLIGLGIMSNEYLKAVHLTKFLKKHFPEIQTVWGGVHPTIAPEMCLKYADYVCVGEGERAVLDMMHIIQSHGSLTTVNT